LRKKKVERHTFMPCCCCVLEREKERGGEGKRSGEWRK